MNNNQISGIELNLSCPNIIGKPQIGYDFQQSDATPASSGRGQRLTGVEGRASVEGAYPGYHTCFSPNTFRI